MRTLTIFAALVAVAMGAALSNPVNQTIQDRVVGGVGVEIEDYPYMAQFRMHTIPYCGAAILSEFYAITAAHCFLERFVSYFSVRVGSSHRERGGQVYDVEEIHPHPQYDKVILEYDLGVVKVSTPIVFGLAVQPIPLPELHEVTPEGTFGVITGWGDNMEHPGMTYPNKLQATKVPTVDLKRCVEIFLEQAYDVTDRNLCAGTVGRDACSGDSGGPLVANGKLIGIVTWGIGCGEEHPGIYANVADMRDFIADTAGL